ncbi:hypothetical protein SAMN04489724_3325 [Algoriphagus locisalis]|uniref:Uncharacterized protein n=1 Tax=Algoriphagus locisalis TaxID=305507 RepID=A0A1I7CQJ4_9BACT|nr:hypothetical protein [Algoriphagus locisalis]SFU01736.1 hypothetical protein SAMN04489724_3325 [Algoriphagus locisalis]
MRKLIPITTEYIKPSRSIDILHLESSEGIEPFYIYNYEGLHFHYFDSLIRLIQFFEEGLEANRSFYSGQELDDFLNELSGRGLND